MSELPPPTAPPNIMKTIVERMVAVKEYDKARQQVRTRLEKCEDAAVCYLIRLIRYIDRCEETGEKNHDAEDDTWFKATLEKAVAHFVEIKSFETLIKIAQAPLIEGIDVDIREEILLDVEYSRLKEGEKSATIDRLVNKFLAKGSFSFIKTGAICGTILYSEGFTKQAYDYATTFLPQAVERNNTYCVNHLTSLRSVTQALLSGQELLEQEEQERKIKEQKECERLRKGKKGKRLRKGKETAIANDEEDVALSKALADSMLDMKGDAVAKVDDEEAMTWEQVLCDSMLDLKGDEIAKGDDEAMTGDDEATTWEKVLSDLMPELKGIKLYALSTKLQSKLKILVDVIMVYAKGGKAIVFTDTQTLADEASKVLSSIIASETLHSYISNHERENMLDGFQQGKFSVLVAIAMDVAPYGLDIPNVDLVVHYYFPKDPNTFVHNYARTHIVILEHPRTHRYQTGRLLSFEKVVGVPFEYVDAPSVDEVLEICGNQVISSLMEAHSKSVKFLTLDAQRSLEEKRSGAFFRAAMGLFSRFSQPPSSTCLLSHDQVVAVSSYYLVNPKTKNIPYSGTRVSELGSSSRSFIPCSSSELTPYLRRRRTLDITSPYILMDHDVVEGTLEGVNTSMIVVERVVSLEFFYNEIFDKFMNDSGLTIETINSWSSEEQTVFLASWWEHIACSFQKILGDIVRGLVHIYSLGYSCGGLKDHVYVANGHGKILPFTDLTKTDKDDLDQLIIIMNNIIRLPRLNLNTTDNLYLPVELLNFLDSVTKYKHVPVKIKVNHPYFWKSSGERSTFMRKYRKLLQVRAIDPFEITCTVDRMMIAQHGYGLHGYATQWMDYIPVGSVMYAIMTKEGVREYKQNYEIVRFFNAVMSHANEEDKSTLKVIKEAKYELEIRNLFPNIYACLYETILNLDPDDIKGNELGDIWEWMLAETAP